MENQITITKNNLTQNIVWAVILGAVLLVMLYFINSLRITGLENRVAHFWMEILGFVLATGAGFAALKQLKGTESSFYVLIAVGFFANGFQDLIHAAAAIGLFGDPTSGQSVFIPATWTVGRVILSTLFLLAVLQSPKRLLSKYATSLVVNYLAPTAMVVLALTTIILLFPVPAFILPDFPDFLHRPYETLAIIPFFIALPFLFRKTQYRGLSGTLLVLSVISGIFVGIYMMNSTKIFDVYFNWAHILKDVSYLLFALALFVRDPSQNPSGSAYRHSIQLRFMLGFGAMTLVAVSLFIAGLAIDQQIIVHEVTRYLVFLAIITIIFGITYPMMFRNITRQLSSLTRTADDISKGKLDTEVGMIDSPDEVGDLARSFDRTVVSLKLAMRGKQALSDERSAVSEKKDDGDQIINNPNL